MENAAQIELSNTEPNSESEPATATPDVQQSTTQEKCRQAKRQRLTPEERKERADALQSRLQASIADLANADRWTDFIRAARGFGTTWSFNNLMLITAQAAERGFTPSLVKTFRAWRELGRTIKAGEKALYILEPVKYRLSPEEAEKAGKAGYDSDGNPRLVMRGARPSPRFDISQTEGEPVPARVDAATLVTDEDFAAVWETVADQIRQAGYNVAGGPPGQVDSYTDPETREVWICDTLDDVPAIMATLKELAHILLGHFDDPGKHGQHRGQIDAEAKSVAFVVTGALGIETATPNVVSWWDGLTDLMPAAAERITATAQQILKATEKPTLG